MGTPQMRWREMHQSGAGGDHVGDAVFAPGGIPGDAPDLVEGALAEGDGRAGRVGVVGCGRHGSFHGDEPLLGGAEDDGVVAAPAVGVGVVEVGLAHEGAAGADEIDDDGVGLEDLEALVAELGGGVAEAAGGVDVAELGEAVAGAGEKVVGAVRGGGVDGTGTLLGGDVVGVDAQDEAVEEGVLEGDAVELRAGEAGDLGGVGEVAGGAGVDGERFGDDVDVAIGVPEGDVVELGVEGDGEGRGEGPGGGGPDDGENRGLARETGGNGGGVGGELVADVDGGRGVHFVLDLGLGEGGAIVDAPVDGFEALVDEAVFEEGEERFGDGGLILLRHGQVGICPAAKDAEAFKLRPLEIDVLLRVLAAGATDGDGVHVQLFAAELLVDLDFDGEAVAVPAGDVGGVKAGHGLGFDDEVLDALVESVAEVDGAVGVWRAVVEDVLGCAGAGVANLAVQVFALPCGEASGLVERQVSLHGKGRLRQIESGFERLSRGLCIGPVFGGVRHRSSLRVIPE